MAGGTLYEAIGKDRSGKFGWYNRCGLSRAVYLFAGKQDRATPGCLTAVVHAHAWAVALPWADDAPPSETPSKQAMEPVGITL